MLIGHYIIIKKIAIIQKYNQWKSAVVYNLKGHALTAVIKDQITPNKLITVTFKTASSPGVNEQRPQKSFV